MALAILGPHDRGADAAGGGVIGAARGALGSVVGVGVGTTVGGGGMVGAATSGAVIGLGVDTGGGAWTTSPGGPAFRLRVTSLAGTGAGAGVGSGGGGGVIAGRAEGAGTGGGVTGAGAGATGVMVAAVAGGAAFRLRVRPLPGRGVAGVVWASTGEAISRAAKATGIFIAGVSRLVPRTARPSATTPTPRIRPRAVRSRRSRPRRGRRSRRSSRPAARPSVWPGPGRCRGPRPPTARAPAG